MSMNMKLYFYIICKIYLQFIFFADIKLPHYKPQIKRKYRIIIINTLLNPSPTDPQD